MIERLLIILKTQVMKTWQHHAHQQGFVASLRSAVKCLYTSAFSIQKTYEPTRK